MEHTHRSRHRVFDGPRLDRAAWAQHVDARDTNVRTRDVSSETGARVGVKVIAGDARLENNQAITLEAEPTEQARRLRDADVDLPAAEQEEAVRKRAFRYSNLGIET